jgi:hypothetical protein
MKVVGSYLKNVLISFWRIKTPKRGHGIAPTGLPAVFVAGRSGQQKAINKTKGFSPLHG